MWIAHGSDGYVVPFVSSACLRVVDEECGPKDRVTCPQYYGYNLVVLAGWTGFPFEIGSGKKSAGVLR